VEPSDIRLLITLLVLLLLSGFFSSAETALTSVNKLRIKSLAEEQVRHAAKAFSLIDNPSRLLSTLLIGNNIVNLTASSITAVWAGNHFNGTKYESIGVGVTTGVLTFIIILFAEILPKTIASAFSEKIALAYTPFVYLLCVLFTPLCFFTDKLSVFVMFLLHIDPTTAASNMTETELRAFVETSHEKGVIESEEKTMITNVVDFGDSLVKDVMVTRTDMSYVTMDQP
jgi:Mg2+/Co2+ transporter CorB